MEEDKKQKIHYYVYKRYLDDMTLNDTYLMYSNNEWDGETHTLMEALDKYPRDIYEWIAIMTYNDESFVLPNTRDL